MTDTAIVSATYIVEGATDKELAHNAAVNRLEQFGQVTVAKATTVGPASPAQGTAYLVGSVATGNFSAQADNVAAYYSGYFFLAPREGWKLYNQETDLTLIFDGSVWAIERLAMPSFSVAGVPSASTAAQMIYVTNDIGGAVPAFSDGTNWLRVTDRIAVSVA